MDRATQKHELERVIQDFLLTAMLDGEPSKHTFDLPDDVMAAIVELESLRDDSANPDEPTALSRIPLKPRPHLSSGKISLPEPD